MAKKKIRKKKKINQIKNKPVKAMRNTGASQKGKRKNSFSDSFRRHKSLFIIGVMLLALLIALTAAYAYIIENYTVTTVYVEGNVHYTNEEIMETVMEGRYGNNSLFLSLKYKDKSIVGIPFVEKMDITILDPHTIKIEVYEKAVAGYVEYLERYLYFDKDGIVVESSSEKTRGIPMVTGLSFDHIILYEPLPVENNEIFTEILSITQLVSKYSLSIDRIYFGSDSSLTLYFNEVRVALGSGGNLEEKIIELQYMLPELEEKRGTLRMESYTEDTRTITFEPD